MKLGDGESKVTIVPHIVSVSSSSLHNIPQRVKTSIKVDIKWAGRKTRKYF